MSELRVGLIGGSGLGEALGGAHGAGDARRHEIDTPFGRPSDVIVETTWGGVPVFLLSRHGPGHLLNPSKVPYRANIFALKSLGCTHILASGAVGSLREEFKPTELVIPDQVIDKTFKRDGTFFENAAVHVEFAEPFDPVLRQIVLEASRTQDLGLRTESGAESASEGPTDDRLHAEDAEVVRSNPQRRDALRFGAIGEIRALGGVVVDRREVDRRALVAEGEERRTRQVAIFAALELVETDQPIG
jgi:purine nucleoside phosphorylase